MRSVLLTATSLSSTQINSAFSQLYRAQIFECAWLDFEARKNPTIARLIQEKKYDSFPSTNRGDFADTFVIDSLAPTCCCPDNATKQIENCRMFTFKDPTLKEATEATIIDQFQHDYSSKMALFLESKMHLCKSCGGAADTLIFLTPVQSMKLGMSILDTFHERKLKQLNQRLQQMVSTHFLIQHLQSSSYGNAHMMLDEQFSALSSALLGASSTHESDLVEKFYEDLHRNEVDEKGKYFQQLRQNIEHVEQLTKNVKTATAFLPVGN